MEAKCKKCGKPLYNPASIARGMGPGCAGTITNKKRGAISRRAYPGMSYPGTGENHANSSEMAGLEDSPRRIPTALAVYPTELVNLVLSAPAPGSIAAWVKKNSISAENKGHHIRSIKQIRRACIEHRLLFWPGLSMKHEHIACIPCGIDNWKIGENGRVLRKEELLVFLIKYEIIAQEQHSPSL